MTKLSEAERTPFILKRTLAKLERDAAQSQAPSEAAMTVACNILWERVAEAFEPDWRDLIERIYLAMRCVENDPSARSLLQSKG